jgi:DNA-binding transcriptional LysR family regulator
MMLTDGLVNLVEEQVDLAVRIGELPDSSLVATRVGSIRRVVCGSPAYFAERGLPQRPDDLAAHGCITHEGLMSADTWTFATGQSEISVPIHSRLVVNTAEAAIEAAIAGVGVTRVLSYQIVNALGSGALVVVLDRFEPPPSPVSLVHTGGRLLPLKVRAFLDFAAPKLKAGLIWES